jgi:hypothetical protein
MNTRFGGRDHKGTARSDEEHNLHNLHMDI